MLGQASYLFTGNVTKFKNWPVQYWAGHFFKGKPISCYLIILQLLSIQMAGVLFLESMPRKKIISIL